VVSRAIFADARYVTDHADRVRAFLAAWQRAWRWAFANPDQAIAIFRRGSDAQDPAATLRKGFSFYSARTQRTAPISGLDRVQSDAVAMGVLPRPLTAGQLRTLVDDRYATAANG
jgi:ABC-type nitrate/sulfonate/bicarbonate transport system substrate-binding protein